ncbi:hypothetical protein GCM10009867_32440 [Pedococcus aerophilus]|uniref:DUF304 domain-containing protein n=1 Tax=Pedococcus aerophilus TaxID=436356 RepID=A0ABN3UUU1_9MICO
MVGAAGARGWGIERIQVVDERLARRFRSALWTHTLRSPLVLRQLVPVVSVSAVTAVVCALLHPGSSPQLTWWLMGSLPVVALVAYVAIVLMTMWRNESWLAREVVPGRFIAVTVGQESIRVRDHDSSVEYGYSLVTGVHQYGDVVVIEHSPSFWTLPLELFEVHELSVIRARAGRTFLPTQGTSAHPLEVGPEVLLQQRSHREGRVVR